MKKDIFIHIFWKHYTKKIRKTRYRLVKNSQRIGITIFTAISYNLSFYVFFLKLNIRLCEYRKLYFIDKNSKSLRVTNLFSSNIKFSERRKFLKKIVAQLILNCPLLPSAQNNLAGKRLMAQKFLATPLCIGHFIHIFTVRIFQLEKFLSFDFTVCISTAWFIYEIK